MEILINASAPTREAALIMMEALGIAEITKEQVEDDIIIPGGVIIPLVNVHIAEVPHSGSRSLWNFWYYGDTAQAMLKPEPEEGWYDGADIFEKTTILDVIDVRTGISMEWKPFLGPDGEPPGYETSSGIRLYDPTLISSPNLYKQ